ncbi:hypothetical protein IWZ00DRAFT_499189 [Phyllosticta capitalensis]|uniref:Uncharacterized protein n=1 Tax=Phyllosticta capitalensis TaxID=121624 RepID=A0ABR1YZG3_9PEZI
MKKLELLVHISAPTTRTDDERYRQLAVAADDFEATARINCTAQDGDQSFQTLAQNGNGESFIHQARGSMLSGRRVEQGKPRNSVVRPAAGNLNKDGNPYGLDPMALETSTPSAETKGKTSIQYAAAPDFGSFTSTSRTSTQQLDEIERRWSQQHSSSKKRPSLSLKSLQEASSKGGTPEFIGDTQHALAALIDHVPISSLGLSDSETWNQSPIDQPPQKRQRLSPEHCVSRDRDMPKVLLAPTSTECLARESRTGHSKTHANDARVPGRPSQLRDSYGLSNSHSQSSKGKESWPEIAESASVYFELPLHGSQQSQTHADENEDARCTKSTLSKRESSKMVAPMLDGVIEEIDVNNKISAAEFQESSAQSREILRDCSPGTAQHDEVTVENGHVFASLPIELWFPPPATAQRKTFDGLTETLESFGRVLSPSKYFKPSFTSRPIKNDERGCWIIQTNRWKPRYQIEFWAELGKLVTSGRLGAVWCQRNVPQDWTLGGTDGKEGEGLGTVWVFCWGQAVIHLWLAMLLHSHREIRKSQAQWTVGSPENIEVVVQMP